MKNFKIMMIIPKAGYRGKGETGRFPLTLLWWGTKCKNIHAFESGGPAF